MTILVCGSREWDDAKIIYDILYGIMAYNDLTPWEMVIIEGQCPVGHGGADRIAQKWAEYIRAQHLPFPAETKGGFFLGPERNQRMVDALLEGRPDEYRLAFAFKDGFQRDSTERQMRNGSWVDWPVKAKGGTEDCVRRVKAAGIPVYIVSHG